MAARSDLSFEEFIEFQFGPAVRPYGNPWYFDLDADWWEPEPRTGIEHLRRLFSDGPKVLAWFSDAQIAQGLDGLINVTAIGGQPWMLDPVTPAEERAAVWHAIAMFFADLLAPRCSARLGHLSEDGGPLNRVAYMWWEGFPGLTGPDDPKRELVNGAELCCLEAILSLSSAACQEAALHGLGHRLNGEPRCVAVIDAFLSSGRAARPELIAYARAARTGCVN
jgi:hypothetical protein